MIPELVFSQAYSAPLPANHRFPMPKFRALLETLQRRGLVDKARCHEPAPAPRAWLERVHSAGYVDEILEQKLSVDGRRRLGLPVTDAVTLRSRTAVAGTVLTARLALRHGLSCNLAGGSHHAHADFGSGFCVFNDVAVAIRLLQDEGTIKRALIIDLDVHQGDGTAAIFEDDPSVVTLSLHCRTNFPARKQRSNVDIALEPETGDADYLATLRTVLRTIFKRAAPDLIFYNAGVDPHRDDKLGRLALTDKGLAERDTLVLEACRQAGRPVACVVGGGYGDRVEEVVARHAILHAVARDLPTW